MISAIRTDLENQYVVVLLTETDLLSNLLIAFAIYRGNVGHTPATLVVNHRLILDIVPDVDIIQKSWPLRDALYLSTYHPHPIEECDCRTPTAFNENRRAV